MAGASFQTTVRYGLEAESCDVVRSGLYSIANPKMSMVESEVLNTRRRWCWVELTTCDRHELAIEVNDGSALLSILATSFISWLSVNNSTRFFYYVLSNVQHKTLLVLVSHEKLGDQGTVWVLTKLRLARCCRKNC